MKKIVLSLVCLIGIICMSFTKNNSNRIVEVKNSVILDFNKNFNLSDLSELKGAKKSLVTGTSATSFPGNLNDSWSKIVITDSDSEQLSSKLDIVLAKY
jgi:hypothetical protein